MDRPTENHASNSVTVLLRSNVLLVAMKNEINKLLHSKGHLSIVAHVGSSHKSVKLKVPNSKLLTVSLPAILLLVYLQLPFFFLQ
jgi:hypothetical protein